MKHEVNDIIAGASSLSASCAVVRIARRINRCNGFRKAGSSDIVNVEQCPVLAPQLEALLPRIRACLASLHGTRHLGHVELVQAGSGTLMILRHTAPLSAADKENWNAFRILRDCLCSRRRLARYWKRYLAKRPGMIRTAYV